MNTTAAPGADSLALIRKGKDYLVPVYRQRELILDRGQGSRLWDVDGREYIDFAAGIAVNALGYGDPEILAALQAQAAKLWHTSNVFYSEPPLRLAEELVAASGFAERVFLCNSGTEANEAAIKLVRRFAAARDRAPERRVILSFEGSFHGRTLAAVTATAQPKYQQGYEPLPGGFRYGAFNDVAALDATLTDDVAAVIVEPIQGEGGVVPATSDFLQALRERCDAVGALLVFDEIQCGMGRTGRLWAHQWHDVKPDVMTIAKALGCGFPIGAMLVNGRTAQTLQFGAHGTTFGGNPLAAAVARVALRRLSAPELLAQVERQSVALQVGLERIGNEHAVFSQVRGQGLMLGAVLAPAYAGRAGELLDHAARNGLLTLQAGADVLRFVPALTIGSDDLDDGLRRLDEAVRQFIQ
ncbi:aspartate aminotransferase family protein [Dokdonella koreensis]|uniref:Acetylornithine aminotransferase n=1 Tax=Dokdonella koreensis DS-123 TaxID=1300342 RepID=A0A160DRQ7_9GAMM|nr:acetylornithine/succinylornithine family transaminase [Dokdonella koreensis]ANB16885.1 Acetylornithine aminotransferase [Dokdonella koreensis DS-123]